MPFKPGPSQPDFSSLFTSLSNSKTQVQNYSLYQTIFFLITNTQKARDLLVDAIDTINEQISEILAASFLPINDETNDFPNSRQLLAGTGISFDDTVPGERTINATGSGGNYYDSPLTDGNEDETELIFGNGDPIICQVPNVP
jgi:hypothetical protein